MALKKLSLFLLSMQYAAVNAQFTGGIASGSQQESSVMQKLDGTSVQGNEGLYRGSSHDGYSTQNIFSFQLNGTPVAAASGLYRGNNDDGYASFLLSCRFLNNSPLPVELTYFTAECNDEHFSIRIYWRTETETENDFFTLEKTTDLVTYHAVAKLNGAGTSTVPVDYSFEDKDVQAGVVYYRLTQTDFNGDFTRSMHIAARCGFTGNSINVFPNPFNGYSFTVDLSKMQTGSSILLRLFSSKGALVFRQEFSFPTVETIELKSRLSPDIYLLEATSESESCRFRIRVD